MRRTADPWRYCLAEGDPAQLFADVPKRSLTQRQVTHYRYRTPAIVLGSSQESLALPGAVVRRNSGGGAVLLVPGRTVWVDVILPRGDSLWVDDVNTSSHWLGRAWVDALRSLGVQDVEIHEAALTNRQEARRICFAGLGPGEVTLKGRKVVGISQRRTSSGAMFQCVALIGSTRYLADEAEGFSDAYVDANTYGDDHGPSFLRSLAEAQSAGIGDIPEDLLVDHLLGSLPGV